MTLRSGPNHTYKALWVVQCWKCGETRIAWAQGREREYIRLNPTRHACQANVMWHDDLPRSWFSAVLADNLAIRRG